MTWKNIALGDCIKISKGKKHSPTPYETTSFRYINIEDLHGGNEPIYTLESGNLVNKNDLIIAWDGANAGKVGLGFEGVIGSTLAKLSLTNKMLYPRFAFWYLESKNTLIKSQRTGATIPHINGSTLKELIIPLPPLSTQRRIAEILDTADTLRRKDQELLLKYDELAQAIFIDMFGDPVRNEKGWEMKKLGDLSDHVSSGSTPLGGSSVYQDHGIKFIRSQNIQMSKIEYETMICISKEIHDSMKRTWVKNKDVLLNITGASIGRVAVYEGDDNQANVNQHVCIIRTKKDLLNPYFLMELIASNSFQRKSIGSSAGGTREAFTFEMIKQFSIIYPPIKYQNRFQALIENLRTQSHIQNSNYSEPLFESLLQKAFSGELIA